MFCLKKLNNLMDGFGFKSTNFDDCVLDGAIHIERRFEVHLADFNYNIVGLKVPLNTDDTINEIEVTIRRIKSIISLAGKSEIHVIEELIELVADSLNEDSKSNGDLITFSYLCHRDNIFKYEGNYYKYKYDIDNEDGKFIAKDLTTNKYNSFSKKLVELVELIK